MSYAAVEVSTSDGQPIELYVFQQALKTWYYTTGPDVITRTGIDYEPATITRSAISQSNETSGSAISLTFPRDHDFARQFLGFAPDLVTTLTIFRGHATDTSAEFLVFWKGRVISGTGNGPTIDLACESVFTSLQRTGLRARYQRQCRHALYSPSCTLNMDTYKVTGVVQSVNTGLVTCTQAAALPNGWFTGGILRLASGATRFIISHSGAQLQLSRPFAEDIGGQTIDIFPGCDHLKSTCISKFNNLLNFGGFPYIPSINPFGGTSIM